MYRDGRALRHIQMPLLILADSILGAGLFVAGPRAPSWIAHNFSSSQVRMSQFPRIILWAWERPADLQFIDPKKVGVAFLASIIYFSGNDVVVRPRLQPLKVPRGTFLIATVRIETNHTRRKLALPLFSPGQRTRATAAIADAAGMPSVQAVQIDFDATTSERAFYRDLLNDVRRQLPDSTALSITALASWCAGDQWMDGLPINEAVPMLFRMGPDRREILRAFRTEGKFASEVCNQSMGISIDEPLGSMPDGRRVYIFRPGPWSETTVRAALGGLPQ